MRALSFGIVCVIVAHALGALLPWPGPWREAAWLVAALGLGLGAAVALARLASWRVAAGVAVAGVAAWLGCLRGAPGDEPPLDVPVVVAGVVSDVEREGAGASVTLTEAEVALGAETWRLARPLRARFDWLATALAPGAPIRFEARLGRARAPWNPSTVPRADPPLFARARTAPEPREEGASWATRAAIDLRATLTFDSATATALYRALLLGDRSDLDVETRHAYQDTGTAHLLAISGMNLALLGWAVFRVLVFVIVRAARVPGLGRLGFAAFAQGHRPRLVAALAAFMMTAMYTAIIAPSDATDRALLALALTLGGIVWMRPTSGWRTLAWCVLATALAAPETLGSCGFELSLAATASLVAIAPHARAWMRTIEARVRSPLAAKVLAFVAALALADVACFLATAPLTVAWFGQLPVHGLWVNLVAIPLMTFIVFPAGVVWLALASLVPALGDATAPLLGWLAEAFTDFVRAAGAVAGNTSTESWPLALGLAASAALVAMLALGRLRVIAGAIVLACTSGLALAHESPAAPLEVIALDVGHGDAIVLRLPDGSRALVDTGGRMHARDGDANRALAERVVVPALRASGVASIDLLVLTHGDLDHVGAAAALSERVPIRHALIGPCAGGTAMRGLRRRLEAGGTRVQEVARGPAFGYGGATWQVLSPDPERVHEDGTCASDNDGSLVLRVTYAGRTLLLTGDIEAATEAELVAREGERLGSDVLKVPHHGSRTSSTPVFLDAVRPGVALVSGVPGPRPPPHEMVLERYRARGIATWITGRDGAARVRVSEGGALTIEGAP